MWDMLTRHEIKVLLKAGHTQTDVARLAGVSRRSVQRVAIDGAIAAPADDHTLRQARGIGRPSVVEHFRKFVVDLFEQEPTLKSVEVCRRASLAGYTGRKSALYGLIASVRPHDVVPLVRFEGVPGEFSQHDFGEVDVEYRDGTEERVRFFASRLKYSRAIQVSLVADQTVESLVRSLATHLAAWGGAPLVCVFDRPKTVALKWGRDGVVTEWNTTFAYAALELGIGVEVCWPYRAGARKRQR
jgi:hypothetical protein